MEFHKLSKLGMLGGQPPLIPFLPGIPATLDGLQLWLKSNDSSTITESGGKVSQWDDKSGNGNHATQGTGANQPTTNASTQNGKNVIDFDGSSDFMSIADSPSISLTGDCTFFFVGNLTTAAGDPNYIEKSGNDAYRLRVKNTTNFAWLLLSDGTFEIRESTSAVTIGSSTIITTAVDIGTNIAFRNDGVSIGTLVSVGTEITDTTGVLHISSNLGSGEFWIGNMSEILIYNRLLSAAEITLIEAYLSNEWGIPLV